MSVLLENPLPTLFVGVFVAAVAGLFYHATRHRGAAIVMIVTVLATGGLVLLERLVVTDREQVAQTLYQIARTVEQNDVEGVLRYASRSSPQLASRVGLVLSQAVVEKVSIKRNLKVVLSPRRPGAAQATFNVVVTASDRRGVFQSQPVARWMVVTLRREDGRWRVTDCEDHPPLERP